MKDTLTHIDPIKAMHTGVVTIDHINVFLLIAFGIGFLAITILAFIHSKTFISHISASLKDPITGSWSPKICTAFGAAITIFTTTMVWLKYAFVANDFSQLQPVLIIHYGYLFSAFTLRTAEKMQAKSIDSKTNGSDDTTKQPV